MQKVLIGTLVAGLLASVGLSATAPIGVVSSASKSYVLRGGRLVPAQRNMILLAGDRLVTRKGGLARITLRDGGAKGCAVNVQQSSMVSLSSAVCSDTRMVSLDGARAGYDGTRLAYMQVQGAGGGTAGTAGAGGAGAGGAGAGGAAAGGAAGGAAGAAAAGTAGLGAVGGIAGAVVAVGGVAAGVAAATSSSSSPS